jgi:hypothetical protein
VFGLRRPGQQFEKKFKTKKIEKTLNPTYSNLASAVLIALLLGGMRAL